MREYGALRNTDRIPSPPDTVQTLLLAASVGQALPWPTSTGGQASNASTASAHIVRFTFHTTGGAQMAGMVNLFSTNATVPTSGTSVTTGTTAGSTGNSLPVLGEKQWQVPGYSTGWSAVALTSGYCIAEIWRK